jgi:hypothetical protein
LVALIWWRIAIIALETTITARGKRRVKRIWGRHSFNGTAGDGARAHSASDRVAPFA